MIYSEPKLESAGCGFLGLMCPKCGSNYLHQKNYSIFQREEDKNGVLIKTHGAFASIEKCSEFPYRRQSITIHFECEQGCNVKLDIMQHKGLTQMIWWYSE